MEENVNQTEKEMAENEKQNQTGKEVAENEKQNQTGKEVAENANLEQTETIRGLTAQNNPAHPTERVGCEYSAKKSVWNLCNQTKEKMHVGEISTKTRKIYLHIKQNASIIK